MLKRWTIQRAEGIGVPAGLAALLLWPAYAAWESVLPLFAAALAISAFCGLSILVITAFDLAVRRRGRSLRPVRGFDIALGLLLAAPSLLLLTELFG